MNKQILVLHIVEPFFMQADGSGAVNSSQDNPDLAVPLRVLVMVDFFNVPSPHITPQHMLDLCTPATRPIRRVVITHGTRTLKRPCHDTMDT